MEIWKALSCPEIVAPEPAPLVMVGEGPLRAQAMGVLEAAGVADLAWLPGERSDVADVMRGLHAFVLPSLAEGISNTILEAMASGLPVIATAVGGNADLVAHGQTGYIVPPADSKQLADQLVELAGFGARQGSLEIDGARAFDIGQPLAAPADQLRR